jgi:glycosyltransferase involved in cell wall biosynthesis
MSDSCLRIIVTGLIAQHPLLGGVAWDYLQYPLGLARLGHDVYYFEDSGEWPYKLDGGPCGDNWEAYDCSENVKHLETVMSRFGFENKWAYRFPIGEGKWYGLSGIERTEIIKSADLLINVSGSLEHPEHYLPIGKRVYIDSDPVFTQIKLAQEKIKFSKRVNAHNIFLTFGERLSKFLPVADYNWRATRQPVVLSEWRSCRPQRNVFTTVMSWTSYQPLVYEGKKYGQKNIEFERFLDLPAKVRSINMEVALGRFLHTWQTEDEDVLKNIATFTIDNPNWKVLDVLTHFGWNVVDAMDLCSNIDKYREYIQSSKADWSVAKNGYVLGQPGWFSCRSACYLAAGKPVVVQDTGFSEILPTGAGILSFRTSEEAIAGIQEVQSNYGKHAIAARAIAEEYFDSDKVLNRLLEDALNSK